MNHLRIALNLALAIALFCAAAYLLGQDSYYLRERWRHTGTATLFSGAALYCLAAGLICLGAFGLTVAYCWLTGKAAMPDPADLLTHPAYQGSLILRFWYLVLPAFALSCWPFYWLSKCLSLHRSSRYSPVQQSTMPAHKNKIKIRHLSRENCLSSY